jgi:predicted MPP superfamily phosphohydrolase
MRKVNILWAEDTDSSFSIYSQRLQSYLRRKGVDAAITRAKDGDEVYRLLYPPKPMPDVLLVDIRMKKAWNGINTVTDLGTNTHVGLPMIIVSSHAREPKYSKILADLVERKIIRGFYHAQDQDEWCEATWKAIDLRAPTILHLSDIHFGGDHAFKDKMQIEDVLQFALDSIAKDAHIDIVVVSGDISSKGENQELRRAEKFLQSVAGTLKIDLDRFIIIPGNHDIKRGEDVTRRFTNFVEFLDGFYSKLSQKEEAFKRYPELYNEPRRWLRWDPTIHKEESLFSISVFDEFKMIVLGLNSVISSEDEKLSFAKIEPLQLLKIRNALKNLSPWREQYFRIAAFHHNPFMVPSFSSDGEPERLVRNATLVLNELIQDRVKVVLHGHTHYSMGYKYQPYFFDSDQKISAPIYVFGAGTLSGRDLSVAQSYFHVSVIRYELNNEAVISTVDVIPYHLKDDSLKWEKAATVSVSFSD